MPLTRRLWWRKTGTAANSRLWNWMAVPGLPFAKARTFIPPKVFP